MPDLESCYFCDAIEEPLESQPLIPEPLDPPEERQRTVVVCPTCGRKLERAIEPVVAFLTDEDRSLDVAEPDVEEETEAMPAEADDSEKSPESRAELPDGARDVLRLLRNRSFPVDRDEIESVAASAYDLGPDGARAAIDALLDRNVLEEADGQLTRSEAD